MYNISWLFVEGQTKSNYFFWDPPFRAPPWALKGLGPGPFKGPPGP